MPDKPWGIPDAAAVPVPDAGADTLRDFHHEGHCCPFLADHTAAAVQAERERLSAELAEHRRMARLSDVVTDETDRDLAALEQRAEAAEAAIERARALHGPCDDGCPNCHECALAEPCPTIRAIDGRDY